MPLNTVQIKCSLALVDTLNCTRVTMRLYMTQPLLSRQIVTLEQELNTQLVSLAIFHPLHDADMIRCAEVSALIVI